MKALLYGSQRTTQEGRRMIRATKAKTNRSATTRHKSIEPSEGSEPTRSPVNRHANGMARRFIAAGEALQEALDFTKRHAEDDIAARLGSFWFGTEGKEPWSFRFQDAHDESVNSFWRQITELKGILRRSGARESPATRSAPAVNSATQN
jgi:hypothetical protein